MTLTYEFLLARADEAAAAADAAQLDNVKQRERRSEAAWRGMADRSRKLTAQRDKARAEREDAAAPIG